MDSWGCAIKGRLGFSVFTVAIGDEGNDSEDQEEHKHHGNEEYDIRNVQIEYRQISKSAKIFTEQSNSNTNICHWKRDRMGRVMTLATIDTAH